MQFYGTPQPDITNLIYIMSLMIIERVKGPCVYGVTETPVYTAGTVPKRRVWVPAPLPPRSARDRLARAKSVPHPKATSGTGPWAATREPSTAQASSMGPGALGSHEHSEPPLWSCVSRSTRSPSLNGNYPQTNMSYTAYKTLFGTTHNVKTLLTLVVYKGDTQRFCVKGT